ncbi:PIR protein [Plasmodium ovale]|uniref:PIR Superfamily Protein n=2 Tax=Plasmodium ovale TaxID=36330 RepID=A0A1A8WTJ0_PLAOA|nr:PIR Superfamily Protein [Plasmodium ovale curtisi]SBT84571.1 PIR protein [Plasmodium ovale]
MTQTKGTEKEDYGFCRNSPHYEMLVENINGEKVEQNIERACKSFTNDICSFENSKAEEICKDFFRMYKFLNEVYRNRETNSTLTNEDFDFLNYWLNVKLKGKSSNASICVGEFEKTIESQGGDFKSSKTKLGKHLHVIDPDNLSKMELLCELYDTKQKIINIIFDKDIALDEKKLCQEHLKKCYDNYIKGMKNCLNSYDDFYKALKVFESGYKYLTDEVPHKSEYCKINEHIRLPEYDPVLEKEQRKIMAFKIMSAPLMLPFVIPLLYKYTPFGPFLRTKINLVKERWLNPDENGSELLSMSTDTEDNISENEEYNIGYYSATNL